MDREHRKLYTTGEFAAFFDVKKDTLFFYDKIGLFSPIIRKSNGYRYYSADQFGIFGTIITLRNIGIPISGIREFFNANDIGNIISMFCMEKNHLDKRIAELERTRNSVIDLISLIKDSCGRNEGDVVIKYFEQTPIIECITSDNNGNITDEDWNRLLLTLGERNVKSEMLNQGSSVQLEDIKKGNYLNTKSIFVIGKGTENTIIPSGIYAAIYTSLPNYDFGKAYDKLLNKIEEKGFEAISDSYEEYMLPGFTDSNSSIPVNRIRIQVREKSPSLNAREIQSE